MHFLLRAMIAVLAGVGAGAVGFYVAWKMVWVLANEHPGLGHDWLLVSSIFAPGVLTALAAFWYVSPRADRSAA